MQKSAFILSWSFAIAGCGDDDRGPSGSDAGMRVDAGGRDGGAARDDAGGGLDAGEVADPDAGGSTMTEVANVRSAAACPLESQAGTYPVLPGEAGHYAATRLRPPSYPFVIRSVAYDLVAPAGVAQCNAGIAHEVQLYVGGAMPSASPSSDGSLAETIAVPAGMTGPHTNELELETPVTLEEGEYLYVAIQLAGAGEPPTTSLCLGACGEGTAISDVDYWSNATAEPFSWNDMVDDFAFTNNFMVRAYGSAP